MLQDYYLSQNYVLKKMQEYLEFQIKNNPHQYDNEDVKTIITELNKGHCFGFAHLWGEFMLQGNEQEFIKLLTKMAKFNGKVTPDVEKSFEKAISMVRFYHAKLYNEKSQWLLKHGLTKHDCENTEYVSDDNFIYINQFNIRNLYEDRLVIEDKKNLFFLPRIVNSTVYVEYFDKILQNCDNKFISMGGVTFVGLNVKRILRGHAIGLYCKGDEVLIYDSHNMFFENMEGYAPVAVSFNKKDTNAIFKEVSTSLLGTSNFGIAPFEAHYFLMRVIGNPQNKPMKLPEFDYIQNGNILRPVLIDLSLVIFAIYMTYQFFRDMLRLSRTCLNFLSFSSKQNNSNETEMPKIDIPEVAKEQDESKNFTSLITKRSSVGRCK